MHILADLRTAAHGGPGVDHGALADIGAEIDETGHQHHARRDIGTFAHYAVWNGAKACGLPLVRAPSLELAVDLVPPTTALRSTVLLFHVFQPKAQQDSLLGPLVDMPFAIALRLGHAQLAAVEGCQRILDRLAGFAGGGGRDRIARLPGGFDGGFQACVRHDGCPCPEFRCVAAAYTDKPRSDQCSP